MSYSYGRRYIAGPLFFIILFIGRDMQHTVSVFDRVPLVFHFFKCPGILRLVVPFGQSMVIVRIIVIIQAARHVRNDLLTFDPSQCKPSEIADDTLLFFVQILFDIFVKNRHLRVQLPAYIADHPLFCITYRYLISSSVFGQDAFRADGFVAQGFIGLLSDYVSKPGFGFFHSAFSLIQQSRDAHIPVSILSHFRIIHPFLPDGLYRGIIDLALRHLLYIKQTIHRVSGLRDQGVIDERVPVAVKEFASGIALRQLLDDSAHFIVILNECHRRLRIRKI